MTETTGVQQDALPEILFQRDDETDDAHFYRDARLVTHIDDATIGALTDFYRERIAPGARVLDLMSSWVSHLPEDVDYARVAASSAAFMNAADDSQRTSASSTAVSLTQELIRSRPRACPGPMAPSMRR